MRPLSWLRGVFHDADHPPLQPCPHQLELSRLRSQLARITAQRNEALEALAEAHRQLGEAS